MLASCPTGLLPRGIMTNFAFLDQFSRRGFALRLFRPLSQGAAAILNGTRDHTTTCRGRVPTSIWGRSDSEDAPLTATGVVVGFRGDAPYCPRYHHLRWLYLCASSVREGAPLVAIRPHCFRRTYLLLTAASPVSEDVPLTIGDIVSFGGYASYC